MVRRTKATKSKMTPFKKLSAPVPKGISRMLTTRNLHFVEREWIRLDFCGAASECAQRLRRGVDTTSPSFKKDDCIIHSSTFDGKRIGFYATLNKFDYSQRSDLTEICSVGKDCIGWQLCGDGITRLLFLSKKAAVDHLFLCIVLFAEDRSGWRRSYTQKLFRKVGETISGRGDNCVVIPVTSTDKRKDRDNKPYFILVKASGLPSRVYAAFESRIDPTGNSLVYFSFAELQQQ